MNRWKDWYEQGKRDLEMGHPPVQEVRGHAEGKVMSKLLAAFCGALLLWASLRSAFPSAPKAIPPLQGIGWLNSSPLSPETLKGKVVLVDFWEYTCVNCLRTLPYVKAWDERYRDKGLLIIGVHTPEFEFGKKPENVKRAVERFRIRYPVVLDSNYDIWRAFGNQYWPRKYLFDARGRLRYDHIGEGSYDHTELQIQKLLLELHPDLKFPRPLKGLTHEDKPGAVCLPTTRELYVGYARGQMGNPEGYKPEQAGVYRDPGRHDEGLIYVQGAWQNEKEALRHARKSSNHGDYILIKYKAIEVNAVIKPASRKSFRVYVFQDGKPLPEADRGLDIRYDEQGRSYLPVSEPRMYRIVNNREYGTYELKLSSDSENFALYAYTFGACTVPKR